MMSCASGTTSEGRAVTLRPALTTRAKGLHAMAELKKRRSGAVCLDTNRCPIGIEPVTPLNELRISPEPMSGCWLWVGNAGPRGYGVVWANLDGKRTRRMAHRIVYESHHGPVPKGLDLDHLCRTPACVNPSHLEPVTRSENVKRGLSPELSRLRQISKTHCPQGHPYSGDNLFVNQRGARTCRECARAVEKARGPRGYRKKKSRAEMRALRASRAAVQETAV